MTPYQRGTVKGIIMFVSDDIEADPPEPDSDTESDADHRPKVQVDIDEKVQKNRPLTPSFTKPNGLPTDTKDSLK